MSKPSKYDKDRKVKKPPSLRTVAELPIPSITTPSGRGGAADSEYTDTVSLDLRGRHQANVNPVSETIHLEAASSTDRVFGRFGGVIGAVKTLREAKAANPDDPEFKLVERSLYRWAETGSIPDKRKPLMMRLARLAGVIIEPSDWMPVLMPMEYVPFAGLNTAWSMKKGDYMRETRTEERQRIRKKKREAERQKRLCPDCKDARRRLEANPGGSGHDDSLNLNDKEKGGGDGERS